MAVLAMGVAGAAIGSIWGYASLGFTIGSIIGSLLFPEEQPEGPRIEDLKVQSSAYGTTIPILYGTVRIAGNVIWSSDIIETKSDQGGFFGKGGMMGGSQPTTYTYSVSAAVAFCEGPIVGVRKIWANSKLIYNVAEDASDLTIWSSGQRIGQMVPGNWYLDSLSGEDLTSLRIYLGTEDQEPDTVIESYVGTGDVPAHRGLAYCVFEDLQLANYGNRLPNFTFEVVVDGDFSIFDLVAHSLPTGVGTPHYRGVLWNGEVLCTLSMAAGPGVDIYSAASPDGVTWTQGEQVPVGSDLANLYQDGGIFYACDLTHVLWAYSTDGLVWVSCAAPDPEPTDPADDYPMPPGGLAVGYSGVYYLAGFNSTATFQYSTDGVNWVTVDAPELTGVVTDVEWDGKCFWITQSDTTIYAAVPVFKLTPDPPTTGEIVTDLCSRVGLAAGDIDVTDLTDDVLGFVIANRCAARTCVEQLMNAYFFDAVESDNVVKFVAGSGSSVATLNYEDLAAHQYGDALPDILSVRRIQEAELPSTLNILYINRAADYQQGTQRARRVTTSSQDSRSLEFPLVLTDTKAKNIADVIMYMAWIRRMPFEFTTTREYAALEPTDIIQITTATATHEVRITKKDESLPGVIKWQAVSEDASIYDHTAPGGVAPTPDDDVIFPGQTLLRLLDIPLLRDDDDDAGFYLAGCGRLPAWHGAVVFKSIDDGASYSELCTILVEAAIGRATSVLGDWDGPNIFDETNHVHITLYAGTLSSTTELAVLNSANAALLGDEIIQFKTATLVDTNRYILTGLLRGRLGTEWAMGTHAVGDEFIVLSSTTLQRITESLSNLNLERKYKPVSIGRRLSGTTAKAWTNTGVGLECLSPVLIGGGRDDDDDMTINWVRRTRIGGSWSDNADVDLGETAESYEIDIMDGVTVKRTLTATTNTVQYSNAQIDTDFAVRPTSIDVNVYQMSAKVGRGYAGSGTVPYPADRVPNVAALNAAILVDAPFACWRLNETVGATASDCSGNSRHGTYSSVTLNQTIAGVAAAKFDGDDDFVTLPAGFDDFSTGVTFEFLGYCTEFLAWSYIVSLCAAGGVDDMRLGMNDADKLIMLVCNASSSSDEYSDTGYVINKWQHWVITVTGSTATFYRDGLSKASGAINMPRNIARANNFIGKSHDGYFYHGYLREVAVYQGALSAERALAHAVAANLA